MVGQIEDKADIYGSKMEGIIHKVPEGYVWEAILNLA